MARLQRLGIYSIWCFATLANLAVAGSPTSDDPGQKQPDASDRTAANTTEALNEIVVTAQRREEQIMNVP